MYRESSYVPSRSAPDYSLDRRGLLLGAFLLCPRLLPRWTGSPLMCLLALPIGWYLCLTHTARVLLDGHNFPSRAPLSNNSPLVTGLEGLSRRVARVLLGRISCASRTPLSRVLDLLTGLDSLTQVCLVSWLPLTGLTTLLGRLHRIPYWRPLSTSHLSFHHLSPSNRLHLHWLRNLQHPINFRRA